MNRFFGLNGYTGVALVISKEKSKLNCNRGRERHTWFATSCFFFLCELNQQQHPKLNLPSIQTRKIGEVMGGDYNSGVADMNPFSKLQYLV